jgi:hypothetical protein
LHINYLKNHEVVEEMFHAPINTKTTVTISILFIAAPIALLLSASGHIFQNQHPAFAANTSTVGHLYEGGIPGYPYFGGYPNYGGFPYITGYGYPYDSDHSYDYGYGYPYNTGGDHSYDYGDGGYTFYQHHHHHHHHHHTY